MKKFIDRIHEAMEYDYLEIEEDLFRRDIDNLVAEMMEGK